MTEFQTVFEITPGPSVIQMDIYFRLAIGFIVLAMAIGSLVLYVTRGKTTKWKPKLYTLSSFWLSGQSAGFASQSHGSSVRIANWTAW